MKRTPLANGFGLVAAFTAVLLCPILVSHNYLLAAASGSAAQQRHPSSASVETIQFHSTLTGKTLPYNVILPPDYRTARATRYPVLYLLHGLMGHYTDWVTKTNVADYAAQYRMIVVTPEGNDGWYTDSATVPSDKYESYFMKELIPDVQKRYRTIETRYGRAVAGLSMGGYGAVKFGLKYPESFVFAASMSGLLTIATTSQNDLKYPQPFGIRSRASSDPKTLGHASPTISSSWSEACNRRASPRCPIFILTAALKTCSSARTLGSPAYSISRKFCTSIASYREITTGRIGISECKK